MRLGWKCLPGTNTLAYYKNLTIADKKVFVIFSQDKLEKTTSELRRAQAELRLNQSDYERSHVELEQMQEKVNKAFPQTDSKAEGRAGRLADGQIDSK
jgi:hypothetical protein